MDRNCDHYKQKWFVLMHLMRDYPLLLSVRAKLDKMKYFDLYVEYKALYEYIKEYSDTLQQSPKKVTLMEDYDSNADAFAVPANIARILKARVITCFEMPDDALDRSFVEFFVAEDYRDFITTSYKAKSKAEGVDSYAEAKEFVAEVEKSSFTQIEPTTIFSNLKENLSSAARESLGVEFLDIMLNGGTIRGELLGILAPSGGGKSTVANMVLAACVARRRDGWYYSTEQKLKGDLAIRHACLMTGASRDAFRNGYDNTPQAVLDILHSRQEDWEKHCKFMDISDPNKTGNIISVDSLLAQVVDKYKNAEEKPGIILIDWWGRLSDAMSLAQEKPIIDSGQKRQFDRDQLHKLKQLAEEIEVPIVVFHQLSGAANSKGPKAKLTAADAQENKAFNNMFDFCIVLGNRDKDDVLQASTDKARGEARSTVSLRLDGKHCKMIIEENDELEEVTTDLQDFDMSMDMPDIDDGFGNH